MLAAGARGARAVWVSPAVPAAGALRVRVLGGQAGGQLSSPAGCCLNSWRVLFLHIQTEVESRAQPDLVM